MNPPTPEQLMLAYVRGDSAAFEPLYRLIAPSIFGYLLRLTRHRAHAEDLLQVTFAKIHRARGAYIVGAPLMPWVMAIARRSFLDERRSVRFRNEALSSDGNLPEASSESSSNERETAEAIDVALNELPETYREAIQLTKIVGLSVAEAADVLETTVAAVKLRVHRGYALLRERLDPVQDKLQ